MNRTIAILFLCLASCGHEMVCPDGSLYDEPFTTDYGYPVTPRVEVCKHQIDKAISLTTSSFVEYFVKQTEQDRFVERTKDSTHPIEIKEDVFKCPPFGECEGLYGAGGIIYVHHDCIGDSALVHELVHIMMSMAQLDRDSRELYFTDPDKYVKEIHPEFIFGEDDDSFVGSIDKKLNKIYDCN